MTVSPTARHVRLVAEHFGIKARQRLGGGPFMSSLSLLSACAPECTLCTLMYTQVQYQCLKSPLFLVSADPYTSAIVVGEIAFVLNLPLLFARFNRHAEWVSVSPTAFRQHLVIITVAMMMMMTPIRLLSFSALSKRMVGSRSPFDQGRALRFFNSTHPKHQNQGI